MTRDALKGITVLTCIFAFSTPLFAQEFNPHFKFKIGAHSDEIKSFSYEGQELSASTALTLGLDYQFSENWSSTLTYAHASDSGCIIFCPLSAEPVNNQVTDIDYSAEMYQLSMNYHYPLSNRTDLVLNFGALMVDESIDLRSCDDYQNGFLGSGCRSEWVNVDRSNSEFSALLGMGFSFHVAKNWDLQLNFTYSDFREGYSQSGLYVGYRF